MWYVRIGLLVVRMQKHSNSGTLIQIKGLLIRMKRKTMQFWLSNLNQESHDLIQSCHDSNQGILVSSHICHAQIKKLVIRNKG